MPGKPNIIYMGTPDFSVPALKALAQRPDFHVSLVVTQPDRPKGRGKKLAFSPVKAAGLDLGIEIFQPEKINTPQSYDRLSSLKPDFFVVAAYGQMLSQDILDIPKIYPINIHASLLPLYRGAAPIQAAILNMDKLSGVTTMVMAKAMDAGDILLSDTTPVTPEDTAQALHDRLADLGAGLICDTIDQVLKNKVTPVPQDHARATYVHMLKKSDGLINWEAPALNIQAHVNAMAPWPGAFTFLNGQRLKIFKVCPVDQTARPGEIFKITDDGIFTGTGSGAVIIQELMGSSGKRLNADAFLRGHTIDLPARFSMQ